MIMAAVFPEMKKGDVIEHTRLARRYRVNRVSIGHKFDEPVYRLETMAGVSLRSEFTAEELAANGYCCIS